MSKKITKAIAIFSIVLIILITIISTFFIIKHNTNEEKINKIAEIYSNDNIQRNIEENFTNIDDLIEKINGIDVIGIIEIEKIEFKGLVYKGTSLDILAKGVGHFESSPYLNGNVCLAAHNTPKYWEKLHTLEIGDKIIYTSFLGSKEYKVKEITQISETDWSKLSNTTENLLTLITCVQGKPEQRLCVQALEVH